MDEQVIKFRVGVVLLAAGVVTAILVVIFSTLPDFFTPTYQLHVFFPSASGVTVNTPVRKSGVQIGRVTQVALEEEGVVLSLRIDQRYVLTHRERCRIKLRSLVTGDSMLEFVPLPRTAELAEFDLNRDGRLDDEELARARAPLTDGMTLRNGDVESGPLEVMVGLEERMATTFDTIQEAGKGIESAGREVTALFRNLNESLGENEGQLKRILQKTETALDGFEKTMRTVDQLVGDPDVRSGIQRTLAELPKLFDDARSTLTQAEETLAGFQRMGQRAETNLANIERLTKPLGDRGEELANSFVQSVQRLDELLDQLTRFSASLNSNQGTLGQLLNDRELYDKLTSAAGNIEFLSRRLKPILEDVRVFTDKVAADPSILGVKGAVNRRPAGAGIKNGVFR